VSQAVRSLKFVASALVGTAVGTVVGLLVAPQAGAANRETIKRAAGELSAQWPFRLEDLKRRVARGAKKADSTFVQLFRDSGG